MAEGYTPAEDFAPDEAENIEMENRDDWDETQDGFFDPTEEETPFVDNLPDTPGSPESLEKKKFKAFTSILKIITIKLIEMHILNMELYLK